MGDRWMEEGDGGVGEGCGCGRSEREGERGSIGWDGEMRERHVMCMFSMERRVGERHADDGEMRESQGEGGRDGDGRDGREMEVEVGRGRRDRRQERQET